MRKALKMLLITAILVPSLLVAGCNCQPIADRDARINKEMGGK